MAGINPFQAPINYAVDVQSPFEAVLSGFKIGAAGAEAQAKAQALEQAKTAQAELTTLFANPKATATDFARVSAMLPKDQAEGVRKSFELMSTAQQQNRLQQSGQVYAALKSGQPDIAKNLLKEQADAFRNSGREQEAKATETYLQLIDMNPTGSQATIGLMMAALPGGKELLENVDKTLSTGREEAKAPAALIEAKAKAEKAVADATTAQATATNAAEKAAADAAKATADAQKAQVDAKFAEQITLADLKKKAADLGLTQAQTGSALAQTKKLGQETQKIALELEALKATGGLDPAKTFEQEEKLRKEFQGRTKVYGELGTTFNNIKSSAEAKNGPGDIALITGFMKMLDPGSVVRETEFATARDTAGLYERLLNTSQKLQSGQLFALDSKQRQEYVNLAKQYLDSAQKKAGEDKTALGVVVKNYRLNPENVFGPETAAAPAAPAANSVTVGGQTYTRPANFTDAQWNAYKQSVGAR
tara:strand:+ start:819 stop:2252 length:1434 start_codon:yes stop_codon:yes gene_type:complete